MGIETISMPALRALVSGLAEAGHSVPEILEGSRISAKELSRDDLRIPAELFVGLVQKIIARTHDEGLCLLPRRMGAGAFFMASRIAVHGHNLHAALHRFTDFYNLLDCGVRFKLQIDDKEVTLRLVAESASKIRDNVIFEIFILAFYRLFTWLIGQSIMLNRVCFMRINSEYESAYSRHFFDVPVMSTPGDNSMSFSASYLSLPVTRTESDLAELVRSQVQFLFEPIKHGSELSARVRARIALHLEKFGAVPALLDLEMALGISGRTIACQLRREGLPYRDFVSLVRRDLAMKYIAGSTMSLEEIAIRTGYSESSAFSRAFKGWTGVPPKDHRRVMSDRRAASSIKIKLGGRPSVPQFELKH